MYSVKSTVAGNVNLGLSELRDRANLAFAAAAQQGRAVPTWNEAGTVLTYSEGEASHGRRTVVTFEPVDAQSSTATISFTQWSRFPIPVPQSVLDRQVLAGAPALAGLIGAQLTDLRVVATPQVGAPGPAD